MNGNRGVLKVALVALALGVTVAYLSFLTDFARAQSGTTDPGSSPEQSEATEPTETAGREFPVPVKALPKEITPCRACHGPEKDFPVNFQRREALLVHRNVKLNHGGVRVWCLDCHHPVERNYLLPLSDGKLISFEHSYLLCGKCHGTKYRDWRYGIHGKRTGYWNGVKTYYLCVNCHDPHSPVFKPMAPLPPPAKPWTPKEKPTGH